MAQALAQVDKLLFLTDSKVCGFNFCHFVAQQVALARGHTDLVLELTPLSLHRSPATYQLANVAPRFKQSGETVEELKVLAHPQQREVLTLAMNIEQALPDLLEQR